MTELDALAPCTPGRWTHDGVTVQYVEDLPVGTVEIDRVDSPTVCHALTSAQISESLVERITGLNLSQRDFELVMVGLVRSTLADPIEAWTTYYRNSLDDLLSGAADFAPIHERAASLVRGSVLDMGSCFGFFPLRLAIEGAEVTATDLSEGTMKLLAAVSPHLGITIDVITTDAAGVPAADKSVDTVTALHLLEHVDDEIGKRIVGEAIRIARERVVIAVPYETEATACHGHVRTFDNHTLKELGAGTGLPFEVDEHHGGWLTLDTSRVLSSR